MCFWCDVETEMKVFVCICAFVQLVSVLAVVDEQDKAHGNYLGIVFSLITFAIFATGVCLKNAFMISICRLILILQIILTICLIVMFIFFKDELKKHWRDDRLEKTGLGFPIVLAMYICFQFYIIFRLGELGARYGCGG